MHGRIDYTNRTAWLVIVPPSLLQGGAALTLWTGQAAHAASFAMVSSLVPYAALLQPQKHVPLLPLPLGRLLRSGGVELSVTSKKLSTLKRSPPRAAGSSSSHAALPQLLVPLRLPQAFASPSLLGRLLRTSGAGQAMALYVQRLPLPIHTSGRSSSSKAKPAPSRASAGSCLEPLLILQLPQGGMHITPNVTAASLAPCFTTLSSSSSSSDWLAGSAAVQCQLLLVADPGCSWRVWVGPGLTAGYLQQLMLGQLGAAWTALQVWQTSNMQ